jgi:uncharacterized membrane protein YagU involved in acid resistance
MSPKFRGAALWRGAVAGLAGGLAASWVMNRFQAGLSALGRGGGGDENSSGQQGDDATMKTASAISEAITGEALSRDGKKTGGPIVHYVFGSAIGALFGAVAEVTPATTRGAGLPFGATVWLVADEIGVPLAGLSQKPQDVPLSTHASALAAHLVYGATADGVRRLIRYALGGRGRGAAYARAM